MTAKQTVLLAAMAVILPATGVPAVAPGSSIGAATTESSAEPDLAGRTQGEEKQTTLKIGDPAPELGTTSSRLRCLIGHEFQIEGCSC